MKKILTFFFLVHTCYTMCAQQASSTLNNPSPKSDMHIFSNTTLGGYGNMFFRRNGNLKKSTVNLERLMFLLNHKFNDKVTLLTEFGVEDTLANGIEQASTFMIQQAYLKFNINATNYIVAGLFLPRLGILNESHLPTAFPGNERNQVETLVIPSTFRQLGIGFYGSINKIPISYSLSLSNGLHSANFKHGTGIRHGRFTDQNATANNLALIGALQYKKNHLETQLSIYYGGSVGLSPDEADSLKLDSGFFGSAVLLTEAHATYSYKRFKGTILASFVSIPNAADINRAYANNTPENEYGTYAELTYTIVEKLKINKPATLNIFARYEIIDLNAVIPSNGIKDGTLNQQHLTVGLNYFPLNNIVIKTDLRLMHTGKENTDLVINPNPASPQYRQQNTFFHIGLGFTF